tara:strand:- start:397 stop:1050 length:654 start_codon:yes stop_codon:yes gene_type:complete
MSIKNTKQAKRLIEAMAPEGEFLAFINQREAQMLKDAGGSGLMTLAGIPSFVEYGDISGATASQDQVDSFSGGDDSPNIVDEVALTRGPTVVTGPDQEDDNIRMMQALGIPPGVTFTGGDNLINPGRGPSIKNIGLNAALYQLATKNPKAYAAIQLGLAAKGIFNQFKNPDLGLDLTKREERELTTLQTGKNLGLNNAKQNERLQELEDKKAEEEKK